MNEIEFKNHAKQLLEADAKTYDIIMYHPRYQEMYNLGIVGVFVGTHPNNPKQKAWVIQTTKKYQGCHFTIMGINNSWEGYKKLYYKEGF